MRYAIGIDIGTSGTKPFCLMNRAKQLPQQQKNTPSTSRKMAMQSRIRWIGTMPQ